MKKTLRLILILLLSNFAFSQTATFDISGNLTINGYSGTWWSYKYKPTGTSTYTQGPQIQSSGTAVIKLSPFISWDVNIGYYNFSGGGYVWGSDYTTNSAYQNIAPKTTGYNFNFDTSALDEGWRGYRLQNTTALNNSNIAESTYITYENIGKSLFCFWQSGNGSMIVSPKISDLATDKKFSIYGNGHQGTYSVVLGTMSNPYDQTTFHPLKTVTFQGPLFQKVEVFMNNYTGSDNYIAIKTNGNGGDVYFDNFSYEQSVNCFDNTNLTVTNVAQDNATINFNADVAQNSWEINLKNVTNNITETFTVNSNTHVLQNLTGNTSYEVKVRANCAPNLYSNWTPIQAFSTVCTQISAGYETSFLEKPYIDPCWKSINNGINQAPIGGNTNVTARTGSKYIRIQQNSTTQANYLITPYINDLDTNKRIKFYLVSDGNGDYIENTLTIGTMSNPNDATTFVPIKTISPLEMNEVNGFKVNNYWKEHIVYFDNYNTSLNHNYIAIKGDISQYNSIFHIDDFKYENTPICKEPVNLQNEKITYNSAVVKWENYNNINTGEWEIQYGITGFTIGSGTTITTTTDPTTLTNLLPDTFYDFYVRTKCGANYSNWSDRGTFKSKCEGFTIGYTDNFENGNFDTNTCWTRLTAPIREDFFSADSQISYVPSANNQTHSGSKSIRVHHTSSYHVLNNISKKILVSPRLSDLNNERIISFWGYLSSTTVNAIQVGTLSDPDDYLTFTPYKNITTNLTINQWNKYIVDFSEYYGSDKFIGIRLVNTTTSNNVFYIDDFEYLLNDCTKPSALSATQASSDSVLLNWNTNNNNPINCEIEYGPIGFTPGTGTLVSTTSKPFNLSGLSNTSYQFRVRNICSSTINWSELYSFKLSCYVSSPFNENFDQYTATNYEYQTNFCWTINTDSNQSMGGGVADRYINNYTSPPNAAYITNYNTEKDMFLISPYLADFDNNKKIKFWIFGTNKPITVGTISNPLDLNTFEAFQQFQLSDIPQNGKEILVDFSSYTGSNKMIAIKVNRKISSNNVQSVSIDDFRYSSINACKEPINIQFSKITNNSTVIKWDNLNGGNVQIEYGIQGFAIGSGQIVTTTQNEILVSGLNESSTYDFYFHTICNGNNSDLVGPKKIKTTCQPYSIPWLEDFSQSSAYGTNVLPTCMNVLSPGFISKNTNQTVFTNLYEPDQLLTGNGDSSYLWYNLTGKPSITSPPFNLIAGVCYKFNIDARKAYEYDAQGISISVGKGNESHYMESNLSRNGVLSEYNYNTNSFFYTPIENGIFTFIVNSTTSAVSNNMILDNFNLLEGYNNTISNPVIFSSNFANNSNLILEKASNSNIVTTTILGDSKLKMNGGTTIVENFDGSDWRKNQSSISKINFKISAPTTNPLVLKFDLKQTFNTNNNESLFRVVVNGNQIGNVIMPTTNNSDGYLTHEFDLSAYANEDVYISLQHIGKSSSGTGDNAIIDNIEITNFLSSEEFNFKNLKVYPNPTKDLIYINNYDVINSYEITNISGQAIEKKSIEMNDFKINIDKFPSGIYLLKLNSENNSKTIKIVKE